MMNNLDQIMILQFILLITTFLSIVQNGYGLSCTSTPSTSEVKALQALYDSTNGTHWDWKTETIVNGKIWNFVGKSPNPCDSWQGIQCTKSTSTAPCRVDSLLLEYYNLQGTLPSSFGDLVYLTTLQLSYNSFLTGSIPSSIGNMVGLSFLRLLANAISGSIPVSISKLYQLQILVMVGNALQGPIPDNIGNIGNTIIELDVTSNQLTGTVPSSITKLVGLRNLILRNNHIKGGIPESIGNMTSLIELDLSYNAISGSIPTSIGQLKQVTTVELNENQIHGGIPDEIGQMKNLIALDISSNQLTGTIPASIAQLQHLQSLLLYENAIHGSIPESIGNVSNPTKVDLHTNQLIGTFPTSITKWTRLQYLDLSDNQLTGNIPTDIRNMTSLVELYLGTNQLSGIIPDSITDMQQLKYLMLFENRLHGNIPNTIGNMKSSLLEFDFGSNQLTGSIPSSLLQLKKLQYLYVNNNAIHGRIPEDIGSMISLIYLDLSANQLTGSISSSLTELNRLQYLYLSENLIVGSILEDIGNLTSLINLDLDFNQLTGTIPSSIAELKKLDLLSLFNNRLSGGLPPSFTSLMNLTVLRVTSNHFTGSLHVPFSLQYTNIDNNLFYGNVDWLTTLPSAISIVISNNSFTGTLPSSHQLSSNLTFFQASTNFLSGSIISLFDPAIQTRLQLIDLSDNALTGSIPSTLFQFPNITYVILAQNCFTGSIPGTVCDPKQTLQVLVLDGLHAATACRTRLFPGIAQIHTLANTHAITGSIPGCLFGEMPVLQTLHLSGNDLTGSLPAGYSELDRHLQQLSLSHNAMTGTIPHVLQQHGFTELDVSFNQFTGELSQDKMNVSGYVSMQEQVMHSNGSISTTGLRLNNNRLSGEIPSILLDLQYVDMLAGNMFGCDNNDREATLPKHDNEYTTYMCGSDETNTAMIVYVVVLTVGIVSMAICIKMWIGSNKVLQRLQQLVEWEAESGSPLQDISVPQCIVSFIHFLTTLRKQVLTITAVIVVVFVLSYGVLGKYFSSYDHKYVWSISIGYLSGVVPGVSLMVIMIIGLLFSNRVYDWISVIKHSDELLSISENAKSTLIDKKSVSIVSLCLLLNMIVVLTVNSAYVTLILSGITTSQQTILSITMALFKDGWRWLVMNSLRLKSVQNVENAWGADSVTSWTLFVCLFNNIIAPCIATAMLNGNCFYYALVPASNVEYSNQGSEITYCERYASNAQYRFYYYNLDKYLILNYVVTGVGNCEFYGNILISTSFQPSFTYSDQCTATLLSIFAPVWLYMFLFGGIVTPATNMFAFIYDWFQYEGISTFHSLEMKTLSFATWSYDKIRKRLALKKVTSSSRTVAKFDDRKQVILLCNNMVILLSFGLLFPPIAVVGCIAMMIQLLMQKVLVMDLIHTCKAWLVDDKTHQSKDDGFDQVQSILRDTEEACSRFPQTYQRTSKTIVLYVSIIWGIFLWDIVGSDLGMLESVWVFLLMVSVGVLQRYQDTLTKEIWTCWKTRNVHKNHKDDKDEDQFSKKSEDTAIIELVDMSSNSCPKMVSKVEENEAVVENPILNTK